MARHGVRVRQGECFPGCNLRYPGDLNGSAKEVINCHCYLQVGVLIKDEQMTDGEAQRTQEREEKMRQAGAKVPASSLQSSAGSGTMDIGTTQHAQSRMPERDVTEEEILDALQNPLHTTAVKVDSKGRRSCRVIGQYATVCVNPDTGQVVTLWKTGTAARRKYGGEKQDVHGQTD